MNFLKKYRLWVNFFQKYTILFLICIVEMEPNLILKFIDFQLKHFTKGNFTT